MTTYYNRARYREHMAWGMRDRIAALVLVCLLCMALLLGCGTTSTAASINNAQGIAFSSVEFARQSSTILLRAGKINLAQDQKTQSALSVLDVTIAAATTVAEVMAAKAAADAVATSNGATPK